MQIQSNANKVRIPKMAPRNIQGGVADRSEEQKAADLAQAFPEIDPMFEPCGENILVQYRTPKTMTDLGIHIPEETRDTDKWNTQLVKVLAIGPAAFCNRDTLKPWPEGHWVKVGQYIRVPKWGNDRWEIPIPGKQGEMALFGLVKDLDVRGVLKDGCSPMDVRVYI